MEEKNKETPVPQLVLSNAPHIRDTQSVRFIMWLVVIALMPAAVYSVFLFKLSALKLIAAAVLSSVAAEAAYQFIMRKDITAADGSAVLTGLLLAMNVPPQAPVWMVCIGSVFAIVIAKQLFGGLGFNIFNPALAGRAFLMASWPVYMTTGWHHFSPANILSGSIANTGGLPQGAFDAITSATPLAVLKEAPKMLSDYNLSPDALYHTILSRGMLKSLAIGNIGGCIGETSALLLLAGALLLLYRRIITWHIPFSYIGTVAIIMLAYYSFKYVPGGENVPYFQYRMTLYHLLSGGLVLGAFFMATDMVTSPVTKKGMILFGIGCGVITSVIRLWGGYPEGVSYSILLMNATVPLIDRYVRPRVFGTISGK